jgi:arylsulfatase A-like enzyme
VARWPGRIAAAKTSEHLGYFPDLLPTIADVTGATLPPGIDGLSIAPTLFGRNTEQGKHDYLYWEFMGWTAVRQGAWRAVKPARATAWELYDLAADPGEARDLASANPTIVARLSALAEKAHTPVQEGTFVTTARHERDRRAKFGKQDDPNYVTPSAAKKKKKQ